MNIVLTGFTSCGKSATGCALAGVLGLQFHDLDRLVEQYWLRKQGEKLSCRELYLAAGRERFAALERKIALEVTQTRQGVVLSTGGKAPLHCGMEEILRSWGCVVYLKCSPAIIFERMQEKGPPAWMADDFCMTSLERHWRERDPRYEAIADIVVDNSNLSVDATVATLMEKVQRGPRPAALTTALPDQQACNEPTST